MITQESQELETITETMIEQKRRRYHETGVYDIFNQEASCNFFLGASQRLGQSGIVHVSALYCGETIIATHWGIQRDRYFYFIMPTYAGEEWQKYSPGRLLLENLLEWCFENNFAIFDFTIGGEIYKRDWCNIFRLLF